MERKYFQKSAEIIPFLAQRKMAYLCVLLFSLFFILYSPTVGAAVIYFTPETAEISLNKSFIAELRIDTEGEIVNALDIEVFFSNHVLEILDLSTGSSEFPLAPSLPEFSNQDGFIRFQGGVPQGFEGDGLILRLFFHTKEEGEAGFRISELSRVFLNDGKGSETSVVASNASYTVGENIPDALVVSSITHPVETIWYAVKTAELSWDTKEGRTYSYVLSKNPDEKVDEIPDESGPLGRIQFDLEEDGIYYFQLRECDKGLCTASVPRTVLVDSTPPEDFRVQLAQLPDVFEGKRFLSFMTTDKTSGVDRFEVLNVSGERSETWRITESPHVISDEETVLAIKIKAVDKAGNERIVTFPLRAQSELYKNYSIFAIIIGMGIILAIFRLRKKPFSQTIRS